MRLTGHLPSPSDARDWLVGAAPFLRLQAALGNVDNRVHCPPVVDQIANNCCAHASADAAYATAMAAGAPIARPSAPFLYAGARMVASPKGAPLVDEGSMLRSMYQFASTWGLIADNRWPEVPATVNMVPADDCFAAGEGATLKAYYSIPAGAGMADTVEAAVRRNQFPVFAMQVDEKWEKIGSGVWDTPDGPVLGGHAMFVCGCFDDLGAFLIQNSWGPDWGSFGFGLISYDAFDKYVYEAWVQTAEPRAVF